jgi:hypothetical protein
MIEMGTLDRAATHQGFGTYEEDGSSAVGGLSGWVLAQFVTRRY